MGLWKTQKKAFLAAAIGISLLTGASAVYAAPPQTEAAYEQEDLNEQLVMALAWTQNAAEYRELCYQGYNCVNMEVDKAVANWKKGDKPLAIVMDCDETIIDNSACEAGYVGNNNAYGDDLWNKWCAAAKADAMPGAVECLQKVAKQGVEVFYVTNRKHATTYEGTAKNMKELGFPMVDKKHLLLKTDTSNKQVRFDQIAKNYHIVVFMGDNAGDLPIGTYHKSQKDRNAIVDQHKAEFGTRFVVFPNPQYGDWESALAEGGGSTYWKLSPKQKSDLRKKMLKTWKPDGTGTIQQQDKK